MPVAIPPPPSMYIAEPVAGSPSFATDAAAQQLVDRRVYIAQKWRSPGQPDEWVYVENNGRFEPADRPSLHRERVYRQALRLVQLAVIEGDADVFDNEALSAVCTVEKIKGILRCAPSC